MLLKVCKVIAIFIFLHIPAVSAKQPIVFQLDWLPGGDKSPVYVAIQQGFFEQAGFQVKVLTGRGSTDSITRVASGQAQFGFADIGSLMAAKAQGEVLAQAVLPYFTQAPHAFYILEESKLTNISQLAGKRIATSPFTSSNGFLPLVLEENGLHASQIQLIKANNGALGPMLLMKKVDAIIAWTTNTALYQDQARSAGKKIRVMPWSEKGLSLYSSSLIASEKLINTDPEMVQRFSEAFAKAIKFAYENPAQAARNVHDLVPEVDPEVAQGQVESSYNLVFNLVTERDGFGKYTKDRLNTTWQYVSKANELSVDALDPATVVPDFSLSEKRTQGQ
ncbi:ABC transporter substrate-binding protein [Glaciecola sp. 1036]|uniref:ABC transporter substrate-binding protein n=1 Tax=Alteromonadaceae TaxID=72275 RepID=UPI003D034508